MKNFYFLTKYTFENMFVVPYLWCSLKTYYEDNGENTSEWNWMDPFIYEKSDDEILLEMEKNPPDVVGFSVYVWNEYVLDALAQKVKEKFPNCTIVYGGPQQNVKHDQTYFHKKPWVDVCLHASAYGELVLTKILDQYPNIDFPNIPAIYYPGIGNLRQSGLSSFDRRAFQWPRPVFEAQEEHIIDKITECRQNHKTIQIYYETSRGCPYKCIYCEWGGGINTKVIKKSWDTITNDLDWLAKKAKVTNLDIVDANFGIFKEDVALAQFIADLHVNIGYPRQIDFDSAKNNPENLLKIRDIFWEHKIADIYTVSIQTVDETVKRNIERVDLPLETHLKSINYLKEKHGKCSVYIERIIGLPGETVDSMLDQLDIIYDAGLDIGKSKPVPWVLLPEAPAFAPAMREKFKVKTTFKLFDFNPKIKEGRELTYPASKIWDLSQSWVNPTIETVIETYSYTSQEWLTMRNLFSWALAMQTIGINDYFLSYLKDVHDVKPSEFYKLILDFSETGFGIPDLDKMVDIEKTHSRRWVEDEKYTEGLIDLGDDWPVLLPSETLLKLGLLKNSKAFYNLISEIFYKKYKDPVILDLAKWITNSIIDINYDPKHGRKFTSSYDWIDYFNNGNLTQGEFIFELSDYKESSAFWHTINDNLIHKSIAYYCEIINNNDKDNDIFSEETKLSSTLKLCSR